MLRNRNSALCLASEAGYVNPKSALSRQGRAHRKGYMLAAYVSSVNVNQSLSPSSLFIIGQKE